MSSPVLGAMIDMQDFNCVGVDRIDDDVREGWKC
jgi:hypothetical protein